MIRKKFVPELTISEFRKQKWVKGGIFSEFFGSDNEVIDLINTGENRLRIPSWDNNLKSITFDTTFKTSTNINYDTIFNKLKIIKNIDKRKTSNNYYIYLI